MLSSGLVKKAAEAVRAVESLDDYLQTVETHHSGGFTYQEDLRHAFALTSILSEHLEEQSARAKKLLVTIDNNMEGKRHA